MQQNLEVVLHGKAAEYLQARLRIPRAEARRRIELAQQLLPGSSLRAERIDPHFGELAELAQTGTVDSRTAGIAVRALQNALAKTSSNLSLAIQSGMEPTQAALHRTELLAEMERSLSRTMRDHDADFLRTIIRR